MQVNRKPLKSVNNKLYDSDLEAQKKFVEELIVEWKLMWSEQFNDKTKAEGVSVANYASLSVERGTIIHATRDFKALNFEDLLEQHKVEQPDRFIKPNSNVGGWNNFIKNRITNAAQKSKRIAFDVNAKKSVGQQSKKNGRGWLHIV